MQNLTLRHCFHFAASLGLILQAGCQAPTEEHTNVLPPNPPATKAQVEKSPSYNPDALVIGDQLELFVKEDASFNGIIRVRERGDVIIPALGRVPVAGLTVEQAQSAVESALEKSQLRQATVILDRVQKGPGRRLFDPINPDTTADTILVYMTGKVNRPGQHILTIPKGRSIGVYEAILITGGISRFGDDQKTHLLRPAQDGTKQRIPVNLRLIEEGKKKDPPIGHGDIVVVPERVFGF